MWFHILLEDERKISIIENTMYKNKHGKFMFSVKFAYFVVYPLNGHCLGKV